MSSQSTVFIKRVDRCIWIAFAMSMYKCINYSTSTQPNASLTSKFEAFISSCTLNPQLSLMYIAVAVDAVMQSLLTIKGKIRGSSKITCTISLISVPDTGTVCSYREAPYSLIWQERYHVKKLICNFTCTLKRLSTWHKWRVHPPTPLESTNL